MGKKRGRKNNTHDRSETKTDSEGTVQPPLDQKYSDDFHLKQGGSDIPLMKRKKCHEKFHRIRCSRLYKFDALNDKSIVLT